jgi:hypothetical protein
MTADELADHLVEHFNAISEPLIQFQAINPSEIGEADKERNNFAVFVIPNSENETPIGDRGDTCDERRIVSIIVNGPIRNVTKRIAMQFGEQLRRSLYETKFEGYQWTGNEATTLVDYAALKSKSQFLSRFDATYFTFA